MGGRWLCADRLHAIDSLAIHRRPARMSRPTRRDVRHGLHGNGSGSIHRHGRVPALTHVPAGQPWRESLTGLIGQISFARIHSCSRDPPAGPPARTFRTNDFAPADQLCEGLPCPTRPVTGTNVARSTLIHADCEPAAIGSTANRPWLRGEKRPMRSGSRASARTFVARGPAGLRCASPRTPCCCHHYCPMTRPRSRDRLPRRSTALAADCGRASRPDS